MSFSPRVGTQCFQPVCDVTDDCIAVVIGIPVTQHSDMVASHKFCHVNDACNAADGLLTVSGVFGVEVLGSS